jgi:hypothetical protein
LPHRQHAQTLSSHLKCGFQEDWSVRQESLEDSGIFYEDPENPEDFEATEATDPGGRAGVYRRVAQPQWGAITGLPRSAACHRNAINFLGKCFG